MPNIKNILSFGDVPVVGDVLRKGTFETSPYAGQTDCSSLRQITTPMHMPSPTGTNDAWIPGCSAIARLNACIP
jgi:hypothetical protein